MHLLEVYREKTRSIEVDKSISKQPIHTPDSNHKTTQEHKQKCHVRNELVDGCDWSKFEVALGEGALRWDVRHDQV